MTNERNAGVFASMPPSENDQKGTCKNCAQPIKLWVDERKRPMSGPFPPMWQHIETVKGEDLWIGAVCDLPKPVAEPTEVES